MVIHGAENVAKQARRGLQSWLSRPVTQVRHALVNGAAGVVVSMDGKPVNVMGFTIAEGKIVELDVIADPDRVDRIAGGILADEQSTLPK